MFFTKNKSLPLKFETIFFNMYLIVKGFSFNKQFLFTKNFLFSKTTFDLKNKLTFFLISSALLFEIFISSMILFLKSKSLTIRLGIKLFLILFLK